MPWQRSRDLVSASLNMPGATAPGMFNDAEHIFPCLFIIDVNGTMDL